MLLDFTFQNWMPYKDEASFNLVATRERQHGSTLTKIPKFRSKRILPIASIYGGNASGKTAVFDALASLKRMVTRAADVDELLPIQPFMLDSATKTKPTHFEVTFLAQGIVYRLTVEATDHEVVYESLEILKGNGTCNNLYERKSMSSEDPFDFNEQFFADTERIRFIFKGTRENQLFLNSAIQQNVDELLPVYKWFAYTLNLVGVGSQALAFARFCAEKDGFLEYAGEVLSQLDTGVVDLTSEIVDEAALPQRRSVKREISQLEEGDLLTLVGDRSGDYGFDMYIVRRVDSEIKAERLRTVHIGSEGERIPFDLFRESSGTQRLMQLLTMLFDLVQDNDASERVYVVDELDRCFHTMLTSRLIEDFLKVCGENSRKQLLFTTHDLLLMDQKLMRRDEMYITQRDMNGRSELIGLSEYEGIRFDKDLIRSYLDGRFGGIPMLTEKNVSYE